MDSVLGRSILTLPPPSPPSSLSPSLSKLHDQFRGALLGMSFSEVAISSTLRPTVWELLRYHDSRARRLAWVCKSQDAAMTTVSALLLGDVLAAVLSRQDAFDPLGAPQRGVRDVALRDYSADYGLSAQQQRIYQMLLAQVRQLSMASMQKGWADSDSLATGERVEGERGAGEWVSGEWVSGIVSALRHPESYVLAVKTAAIEGDLAAAIAGLLAGAMCGQAGLPVLWQTNRWQAGEPLADNGLADKASTKAGCRVRCCETIAIADELFAQWAGIACLGSYTQTNSTP